MSICNLGYVIYFPILSNSKDFKLDSFIKVILDTEKRVSLEEALSKPTQIHTNGEKIYNEDMYLVGFREDNNEGIEFSRIRNKPDRFCHYISEEMIEAFEFYHVNLLNGDFCNILELKPYVLNSDFYEKLNNLNRVNSISNEHEDYKLLTLMGNLLKYSVQILTNQYNKESNNCLEILKLVCDRTRKNVSYSRMEHPGFLRRSSVGSTEEDLLLKRYQLSNIEWMLERESNPLKIVLPDKNLINIGNGKQMMFNYKVPYNFKVVDTLTVEKNPEYVKVFRGGCISDDPGMGKTVQCIFMCINDLYEGRQGSNLIVVPNHILDHWINQFYKHVDYDDDLIASLLSVNEYNELKPITLITFNELNNKSLVGKRYHRVFVDEFHELFRKKDPETYIYSEELTNLKSIESNYYWALTATPLVNNDMLINTLNFICHSDITNNVNVSKNKDYEILFSLLFCKNLKKYNSEIKTKIHEKIYKLIFKEVERLSYNAKDGEEWKRKCCINPIIGMIEKGIITEDMFYDLEEGGNILLENNRKELENYSEDFMNKMKKLFDDMKLSKIRVKDEDLDILDLIPNEANILLLWDVLTRVMKNRENREFEKLHVMRKTWGKMLFSFNTLEKGMASIKKEEEVSAGEAAGEAAGKAAGKAAGTGEVEYDEEEETCRFCLGEYEENPEPSERVAILSCGHKYHIGCIREVMIKNGNTCPLCDHSISDKSIFVLKKDNKNVVLEELNDLIKKYGTKIAHLIIVLKKIEGKVIMYSHTPSLLGNIINILNENAVKSVSLNIMNGEEFMLSDHKLLVLSSDTNASGIDSLSRCNNIIILEPIAGDYLYRKNIEKQMLGRLDRLGRRGDINLYRFIIKETIEESDFKSDKINDLLSGDVMEIDTELTMEDE